VNPGLRTLVALMLVHPVLEAQTNASGVCPKTIPSSQLLGKPFPKSENWYGNELLAVMLPPDGIWIGMGPERDYRNKLFWWSYGFKPGSESNLLVTGRRVDGEGAPARISKATNAHDESLGGWAMLVMVELPSAGCWEITGEYLGTKLSFVVETQGVAR
jgi:hypothetical protein